ncbi:MAG: carbon monoxide dehydrogenase [Desulfobacteraceae bacterium]|nr:MAG: carbon monoxide dehydrogenase [Desulfobacteraceae bacterium]
MKIAVSGKGGVGKTTLAALLIKALADDAVQVLAIDADPAAHLGRALGMTGMDRITPIARMRELIAERTESQSGGGSFFKLNPRVEDLPQKLALQKDGIRLMVLGGVQKGGTGCICPESTLLKNLVRHLILDRNEAVVLDMEAGLEHLGRGTAAAVDRLIIVVEPGLRSLETARQILGLAQDLGLKKVALIANKVRNAEDREFILTHLPEMAFWDFLPFSERLLAADREGAAPFAKDPEMLQRVQKMLPLLRE